MHNLSCLDSELRYIGAMEVQKVNPVNLEVAKARGVVIQELGTKQRLKALPLEAIHKQLKSKLITHQADTSLEGLKKVFEEFQSAGLLELTKNDGKDFVEWADRGRTALKEFRKLLFERDSLAVPVSDGDSEEGQVLGVPTFTLPVPIRPGFVSQVQIPQDITRAEADFLVQMVSELVNVYVAGSSTSKSKV